MAVFRERRKSHRGQASAEITSIDSDASALDRAVAADLLLRHLFVPPAQKIENIEYAAIYRFAEKHSGGDVVDVYCCGDKKICFSLTDISGKGVQAALHAGLVKYGIRAFASEGQSAGAVLRALNRFYLENDTFERTDSFASVFFAQYDAVTRTLMYASAGHEGILFSLPPDGVQALAPTGPLIGIFPDEPGLFSEVSIKVPPGSVVLAVSDGVTEARHAGELFGMNPLMDALRAKGSHTMPDLCCEVARSAVRFSHQHVIDDIAVLAARFP